MKTLQGAFHTNPGYSTWNGFATLKKDLAESREEAAHLRAAARSSEHHAGV